MANKVIVDHFRGTQAQAELWAELLRRWRKSDVVFWMSMSRFCIGFVQAGSDSQLKAASLVN